eukprot:TRINITY_DN2607_c0_g2_i1.p1 TRINITY_DN2607_c0_g2~~TRINITY_DN2607_c0_g2_i1.p1  ORF type:complete len:651 (+),score=128.46 TRINITY_DN2607_c0_g2_i1:309-2261(+)
MVVAAKSATNSSKTPQEDSNRRNPSRPRTPLLPSEKDNGVSHPPPPRKPKPKEISSRYMSPSSSSSSSSSTRQPSPHISRSAAAPKPFAPKRSQSAERSRPGTPRPTTPLPDSKPANAAAAMPTASKVLWTSSRSLSVSFQGESFSLPFSKIKAPPSPAPVNSSNARRVTPERRRPGTPVRGKVDGGGGDQLENSKPAEQRWPGRIRQANPLTRSLDCTGEKPKAGGVPGSAVRGLQQSMIDNGRRVSVDGRIRADLVNGDVGWKALQSKATAQMCLDADSDSGSAAACNLAASDTESVSSGSNSGTQEFSGALRGRATPCGISIPARFWQETNSRLRRLHEPGSPLSRTTSSPKLIPLKRAMPLDSPSSSPHSMNRGLSSPLRGLVRHPSPSKLLGSSSSAVPSSPSRGIQSPTRMRNSLAGSVSKLSCSTPSVLSFVADVRRGKMGENRIEDAHLLRLLYNRYLQWRFMNARAEAALSIQRLTTEKNLYNAWEATSELRDSVTVIKIQLQLLQQNWKLTTILNGQLFCMEQWALLDRDHSNSLSGAIEALKASTLRLPVIGGARADIHRVKDAVGSAVDVMQALGSSICSLLSKVQGMHSLVAELTNVAKQERELLSQCKDLMSTVAALRVEECSLRTHLLQLKRYRN